jgi:DNA-binding CsgD family transcriptional regulator
MLYGEWLRRKNRRVDARGELRIAHEMFTSIGMEAFAERARRELLATGSSVRRRSVEPGDDLTAQERQIALLARDGMSNIDIAARLFLSQNTVAYHLRKGVLRAGHQLPPRAGCCAFELRVGADVGLGCESGTAAVGPATR